MIEAEPKKDTKQIVSETITDIEKMMSDEFRLSYFPILFLNCQRLLLHMKDKQYRENLTVKLENLKGEINKQKGAGTSSPEELIDEIDSFAKELIEKIKYEQ